MKEEQINVTLPNIGYTFIPVSVIKKWDIVDTNEIGDIVFCRFSDKSYVSMDLKDYNRIFNEK